MARFSQARKDRIEQGLNYAAWLIDAENEKRNCSMGFSRKFYGTSSDEAYAKAIAAGEKAIAKAKAEGKTVTDRFHVSCQGTIYNISCNV